MGRRFFDLSDDPYIAGRWELGVPVDADGVEIWRWFLVRGEPVQVKQPISVPIERAGQVLDFSLADAGTVPVVSSKVASVIAAFASQNVQLLPIRIEGRPDSFSLLNVVRVVKCIDEQRCKQVDFWKPEDGQPERIGHYRSLMGLRIDPSKVGDAHIFRPWGWPIALLVSEELRAALEQVGASGMKFEEV